MNCSSVVVQDLFSKLWFLNTFFSCLLLRLHGFKARCGTKIYWSWHIVDGNYCRKALHLFVLHNFVHICSAMWSAVVVHIDTTYHLLRTVEKPYSVLQPIFVHCCSLYITFASWECFSITLCYSRVCHTLIL